MLNTTNHTNKQWRDRDLAVLWHPCTQMKDHETLPLLPIKYGRGIWLYDHEENRYLDAISSWWVNLFGHSNPRINEAIKAQLDTLEHVIFAGFTHTPAIELAEQLLALAPQSSSPPLTKCFYADNGSTAIEVALKMSHHYWVNQGKPKKAKFIHLANSYHGETIAALNVSDIPLYKSTYKALLTDMIVVPSPDCYYREAGESWQDYTKRQFTHMLKALTEHHHETSAVIIEPLVQCAGGMRMYHSDYLSLLRAACNEFNVHLIADEIAVGFGRTGTLFACEQANITPDFLCLSKGITGGYLPLSTVLTTDAIYAAFYADYLQQKAFLHSHSYTGNTLACRTALASLALFKSEDTLVRNKVLSARFTMHLESLQDHPHVGEVRQTGMISAIELVQDKTHKTPFPWQQRIGLQIYQEALQSGLLLRPLGNVIYFMPPYVITEDEIDWLCTRSFQVIEKVLGNLT